MQHLQTPSQASQWLRLNVQGGLGADSRQISPGDGFVAWPGSATDGRKFVRSALSAGAAACLVERDGVDEFDLPAGQVGSFTGLKSATGDIAAEFYGHPSRELDVVAVTGTNGKTSTAWWLAQALSSLPKGIVPCGVIGTLGVGRAPDLTTTGMTTPDPVLLQRTLRDFCNAGFKACAIEASSIGIEERRLDATLIRTAVFTNFTQDHLDYHASMDHYWQAKEKLFSWPGLRSVVLNIDDPRGAALAQSLGSNEIDMWTTSRLYGARLCARNISYSTKGLSFDVVEDSVSIPLSTALIGDFNVSNVLGVIAAMRSLGIALSDAVLACRSLQPVPGRMECLGGQGEPLVAVDYAHTPDALKQALTALRSLANERGGNLWCVFGCGGDRDASKRPLMGAIAMQGADKVVVTSDNPRSERPETILAHILQGMAGDMSPDVEVDRSKAIAHAVTTAGVNDVILLAGKGHEATQETNGLKVPFSDHAHAMDALADRRVNLQGAQL